MSIIQDLHDSEINCTIATFFDGCFDWKLGDAMNGFKAQGSARSFAEAEHQLAATARRIYPDSSFARQYEHDRGPELPFMYSGC